MLGGHWYKYAFEFYRYAKKPLTSGFFFVYSSFELDAASTAFTLSMKPR